MNAGNLFNGGNVIAHIWHHFLPNAVVARVSGPGAWSVVTNAIPQESVL